MDVKMKGQRRDGVIHDQVVDIQLSKSTAKDGGHRHVEEEPIHKLHMYVCMQQQGYV
jgi:hypothetical protein